VAREPVSRRANSAAVPFDPAAWQEILAIVRRQHPGLNRIWFENLEPQRLSNGVIQATVRTMGELNFCQNQCQQPFTSAAQQVTGHLIAVSFHCPNLPRGGVFNEEAKPLPLSPDYIFDNFVPGPCNRMAHAAAVAVSESPGTAYNPLFIHGGPGLGKTHLLQAVCQKILERRDQMRIVFLSCDSFINHFVNAVQDKDMGGFRARYREVDMLVIDDIHFLSRREQSQEEFFHTFNALWQCHKQIILSADVSPGEIPDMEERLISRFNWGMVARIEKPCYETRIAILKTKSRLRGMNLPDPVVNHIAARIESNTRELEGAITKLQGMSLVTGRPIDLELAQAALGEHVPSEQKRVSIQQIVEIVTKFFNVKTSELQGKKRHKSIALPRQVCMYLARRNTPFSLEEIGAHFGGRDHTTVLHAFRAIGKRCTKDQEIARQVTQLEGQLAA
jgi:chromosomal replication initiator protein